MDFSIDLAVNKLYVSSIRAQKRLVGDHEFQIIENFLNHLCLSSKIQTQLFTKPSSNLHNRLYKEEKMDHNFNV